MPAALLVSPALLLAACTGGGGADYELTLTPVLPRNQQDLLEGLDSMELVVRGPDGAEAAYPLSSLDEGAENIVDGLAALEGATLLLRGYVGSDVVALGQSEPYTLSEGSQELRILFARVDDVAELNVLEQGRSFGALASDGAGRFLLFGGSAQGVYPDDEPQASILALDLAPPGEELALRALELEMPPLESGDVGRIGATATLLSEGDHELVGRILVVGGAARLHSEESAGGGTAYFADVSTVDWSSFVFDPATDTLQALSESASLVQPRAFHTAHQLPTGDVIVVGGFGASTQPAFRAQKTAEIFNPAVGAFERIDGDPVGPFLFHAAATLGSTGVLVCGGLDPDTLRASDACDLVARAGSISEAETAPAALAHSAMAPLPDGRILMAGGVELGSTPSNIWGFEDTTVVADAWIYDGSSWEEADPMAIPRAMHTMVPLPNGDVLVAGGVAEIGGFWNMVYGGDFAVPCAEIYDHQTGRFRMVADLCDLDAGLGALSGAVARPSVAADPTWGAMIAGGVDVDETGATSTDVYVYPE